MSFRGTKCLIAYFSRKGNNYVSGRIVNLPVGNTEVAAGLIRDMTNGDLFRIEAVNAYPGDYTKATEVAHQELQANARPKLTSHVENMASYDVIFLGYPDWWGTMPMAVWTFLEEYDFSGKTIIPFCTHEGSGLSRTVSDIASLCPKSTVLDGLAIRGRDVKTAHAKLSEWLRKIMITK